MFDIRTTNDIVLLIWIGVVALFSQSVTKKRVTVLGQEEERYSLLFATAVFFPIFWFVTTVFMRSDMYAYKNGFDNFSMSIGDTIRNWNSIEKGPGFSLLIAFCKALGINTFGQFRVVLALLQSVPLVLVYRMYSEDYVYSVFLLIANMIYDAWMMNGMRQFLAACIVFAAFPLFLKKKYVFVFVIILVAMTIHSSAVIMIPVFLLSLIKPWSKLFIYLSLLFAVGLFVAVRSSNWLSADELQNSNGAHPLGVIFRAVPVIIGFVGRKQIKKLNNHLINVCVNISVCAIIINIVAIFTSGVLTGRLVGYTSIYIYILLPFLLKKTFNESISKNLTFGLTLYYVFIFFVDLYIL